MLERVWSAIVSAFLELPGVRFIAGLVDTRYRPVWAVLWLTAIAFVVWRLRRTRAMRRRQAEIVADMSTPHSRRSLLRPGDTPSDLRIPQLLEARSSRGRNLVLGAGMLAIVFAIVLGLVRSVEQSPAGAVNDGHAAMDSVVHPEAPAEPTPRSPFAFRERGWQWASGACILTLEAVAVGPPSHRVVLLVLDSSGTVIARDTSRAGAITVGQLIDFRLAGLDCNRIAEWRVRSALATR